MLAALRTPRADPAQLQRIEALVRRRYAVADDDLVLVSEEPGRGAGQPARLTVVLFWPERGERHRLAIFKPPREVGADDLPPGWLRGALRDGGEADCC